MTTSLNAKAGTYSFDSNFIVNRLGYGTMQLTGKGTWGPYNNPKQAEEVIEKAVSLGVNLIDTADTYGPWFADRYLAEALKNIPKEKQPFISDKVGQVRRGPDIWQPLGDPKYLRQEEETSLMTLGKDHVDLLFLHRIDPNFTIKEQVGEIKKFQDEGKAKHIGLSQVTVKQIKEAEKYAKIDAVENYYNIAHHVDDDVVNYTESHGMAFIPYFPLGSGKLLRSDSPLSSFAKKYQASNAQIALAWLLKRSKNMLPIPGTSSIDHLKNNLSAASIELEDEDFKKLSNLSK